MVLSGSVVDRWPCGGLEPRWSGRQRGDAGFRDHLVMVGRIGRHPDRPDNLAVHALQRGVVEHRVRQQPWRQPARSAHQRSASTRHLS